MTRNKTILIIEREINLTNGLKSILEKEGYKVVPVYSQHYLEEQFRHQPPDLAIIDINIPKEIGLNILRKMKEYLPSLPIIAMTVYSNSLNRKEIERLGASDFIAKPFDVEYLKKKIEELSESRECYQTSGTS